MRHDHDPSRDNLRSLRRTKRNAAVSTRSSAAPHGSQSATVYDMSLDASALNVIRNCRSATGLGDKKLVRLYAHQHGSLPGFFAIQNLPPTPPLPSSDELDDAPVQTRSFTAPAVAMRKLSRARVLTPEMSPQLELPQAVLRQASACSDYAETFVTADEMRSVANHTPLIPWSEDDDEEGTSLDSQDHTGGRVTPKRISSTKSGQDRSSDGSPQDVILSPNVTVRKLRPKRDVSSLRNSAHEDEMRAMSDPLDKDVSVEASSPTPAPRPRDSTGHDQDMPTQFNDDLYDRLRDEKSKRLSNVSITSTVVSALVRSNPAKPPGKLRRSKKTGTLRSSNSSPRSARAAEESSPASTASRLMHRPSCSELRAKAKRDSCYSENAFLSGSEPLTSDTESSSEPSPITRDDEVSAASAPKKSLRHKHRQSSLSHKAARDSLVLDDALQEEEVDQDRLHGSDAASTVLPVVPILVTPETTVAADLAQHTQALPSDNSSLISHARGQTTSMLIPQTPSPVQMCEPPENMGTELKLDTSDNTSTLAVPSSRSGSLGPEHAQLLPIGTSKSSGTPTTPLSPSQSQFSDRVEVNEATAVNFSIHKTRSIMVIEQALPAPTSLAGPPRRAVTDAKQIQIARKPVSRSLSGLPTGTRHRPTSGYNSLQVAPSRVAISPPDNAPPEITLCPATPGSSVAQQAENREREDLRPVDPPRRRDSLKEKARRYSSLLQQTVHGHANGLRIFPEPERSTGLRRPSERHLHPDWQPRQSVFSPEEYTPSRRRGSSPSSMAQRFRRSMSHRLSILGRNAEHVLLGPRDPSVVEVYKGHISVQRSVSSHSLAATELPLSADVGEVYNGHRVSRISQSSHALPSNTELSTNIVHVTPSTPVRGRSLAQVQKPSIRYSLEKELPPVPVTIQRDVPPSRSRVPAAGLRRVNNSAQQSRGGQASLRRREKTEALRQVGTGFEVLNRTNRMDSGFEVLNRPARQSRAPAPDPRCDQADQTQAINGTTAPTTANEPKIHKIPGLDYGIQIEGLSSIKNKLRVLQRTYSIK